MLIFVLMEGKGIKIHYDDAIRMTASPVFSVMAKPVGSRCNLNCSYCYYLDKGSGQMMSDQVLDNYCRSHIEGNPSARVNFCWHGGEPLLAGRDFYRRAICCQEKYAGSRQIDNVIQTNGTLLDEQWCRFFADNGFLVGISLDGPRHIHDRYRRDKTGRGSFDAVLRGVELLLRHNVEFNTMTALTAESEGEGATIYRFLKSTGSRFMQFLPVAEHLSGEPHPKIVPPGVAGSRPADWSISTEGFGRFMCDVFDDWIAGDVGRVFVQLFEALLAPYVGLQPSLCAFSRSCGANLVLESDGCVYPCDHFVYPDLKLGDLTLAGLRELATSPRQLAFATSKTNSLPGYCRRCKWLRLCNGECPKHRFDTSPEEEPGLNSLCKGYKMIFSHTETKMRAMARLLSQGKPPAMVME